MKRKPLLRQAGDLTEEDFRLHPVWVHCHIVDYDEPWYDETDEETFRPWDGDLPVDPVQTIFLVRATFVFSDGSAHPGFLTPAEHPDDLGTMQPAVFIGGERFAFWGGMFGIPAEGREALYRAAARTASAVFPIRATADASLARGAATAVLNGFYKKPENEIICEQ